MSAGGKAPRLKWVQDVTLDDRFYIQTEHVRGEGVCYYLGYPEWSPSAMRDWRVSERHDVQTSFCGRGGVSKVKAAAQQIADITWSEDTEKVATDG